MVELNTVHFNLYIIITHDLNYDSNEYIYTEQTDTRKIYLDAIKNVSTKVQAINHHEIRCTDKSSINNCKTKASKGWFLVINQIGLFENHSLYALL